jgi:predicted MFS family arabinose efflux permease
MLLLVTYRPPARLELDVELPDAPRPKRGLNTLMRESERLFVEVWEGIKFAFSHKWTVFGFSCSLVLAVAGASLYVLVIVLVKEVLNKGMEGLGTLIGSLGVGMIVGSVLTGRFGHKTTERRIVLGGMVAFALCVMAFARMRSLPLMNAWAGAAGAALSPVFICLDAMLQKTVPEQFRGRVFSARDALMNGGFLIASVLVGLAAENLNKADTLTVVGLVVILAVVFIRHFSRGLAREKVC